MKVYPNSSQLPLTSRQRLREGLLAGYASLLPDRKQLGDGHCFGFCFAFGQVVDISKGIHQAFESRLGYLEKNKQFRNFPNGIVVFGPDGSTALRGLSGTGRTPKNPLVRSPLRSPLSKALKRLGY